MTRTILLGAIILVGLSGTALPRTWRIVPDGSGDAPTIQDGIDSAATGDTVLVAPGTYTEAAQATAEGPSMLTMKSGVSLVSESGMYNTVLDAGGQGRVILCDAGGASTLVKGFKITGGVADVHLHNFGGGVFCTGASPVIEENWITGNSAHSGGGVAALYSASPVIRWNLIESNSTRLGASGGGIICHFGGNTEIHDNVIRDNFAHHVGGGIFIYRDSRATILRNWIEANEATNQGGGLEGNLSDIEVSENVFLRNEATWGGGAQVGERGSASFQRNTFFGNRATYGAGVSIIAINSRPCTVEFTCNLVVGNIGTGIYYDGGVLTHECNDSWGNTESDFLGLTPSASEFSEDPLFCDSGTDDFNLEECSPCSDGYGCGQIGAYGVGCDCQSLSTEATTWGRIKTEFGE